MAATNTKQIPSHRDDFSERMKRLRQKTGISIHHLSSETGFTEEFLEKLEKKQISPTPEAVIRISKALITEDDEFLSKQDDRSLRLHKVESFLKRRKSFSYTTLTPDSENKHMKAFLIGIEPEAEHSGVEYQHEGEEFIFITEGRVDIEIGQKMHNLSSGQSVHFNSSIVHKMRNPGKKRAEMLVVVFTP